MPKNVVPPPGMRFCGGRGADCGEWHYDGSKGGERPTDIATCEPSGCGEDDDCGCKICYGMKFEGDERTYLQLPFTASIGGGLTRGLMEQIARDERKRAREHKLKVKSLTWYCYCLKDKPITGKKGD